MPITQPIIPLDRFSLWALYCVLDLSYREIDALTNWGRDAIKNKIRAWDLDRLHDIYLTTHTAMLSHVRNELRAFPNYLPDLSPSERANRALDGFRANVLTGRTSLQQFLDDVNPEALPTIEATEDHVAARRLFRSAPSRLSRAIKGDLTA